jgi:hypothetical protein
MFFDGFQTETNQQSAQTSADRKVAKASPTLE